MAVIWGIILGTVYFLIKKRKADAIIVGLCVVSHWLLDLFVHLPDLPLYPGDSHFVGLGLWNHTIVAILLEGTIFIIGTVLYLRATEAKNKIGRYGFLAIIILLVLIYMGNLFGPPPSNVTAIAWAGELQWLFVFLAWWVDRNRVSIANENQTSVPLQTTIN
jgi:hypothetical protein